MGFFASSGILNRRGFFGGTTAAPFSPADISGLQLWLDATTGLFDATSGGSAVTTDGSSVARWEDQSGNGRHATQGTSNNRPVLKTSIQNSKNGLLFDGSNDFLATSSFAHSVPLTLFVVQRRVSGTASQSEYNRIVEHGSNNGVAIIYFNNFRIYYQYASSTFTDSGVISGTTTRLLEYFVDSSSPRNLTFRVNNGNQTTDTRTGTPTTPTGFNIARFGGDSYNPNIEVYEIIYYNVKITDSGRDSVRDYLNNKWSVY